MTGFVGKLEPSSLYVATQSIPTAGYQTFHWFLLVVARDGSTTSHQWVETDGNVGNTEERYVQVRAPTCAPFTRNPSIVALFRVKGFEPACADNGELPLGGGDSDVSDLGSEISESGSQPTPMEAACAEALSAHYPTMHENRLHGLSCKTWVLSVLKKLQRKGHISRSDDVCSIESGIKSVSAEQEELLMKSLLGGKSFRAGVFTI